MNNINEKLIGKTIKEADVDGFGVYLTFDDSSKLEYIVSDEDVFYEYYEAPEEDE